MNSRKTQYILKNRPPGRNFVESFYSYFIININLLKEFVLEILSIPYEIFYILLLGFAELMRHTHTVRESLLHPVSPGLMRLGSELLQTSIDLIKKRLHVVIKVATSNR